ncbi:hypothetical protein [Sorangium cellulosum]|uniref:hypothetical protein n=1 Tax=Sorangium cellulosum TaxID=56 RepID=UPI001F3E6F95|nr:hypothetical protein [Sorangium cellulosum]
MNRGLHFSAGLVAMVVASTLAPACSCSCAVATSFVDPPVGEGEGGAGGDGGQGADGSSGGGGQGGDGAGGGAGGAPGHARAGAGELVSAGEVARSARYRMVFTLGQPTQNQEKTTSRRYRMQGGLIGASGSER